MKKSRAIEDEGVEDCAKIYAPGLRGRMMKEDGAGRPSRTKKECGITERKYQRRAECGG